ncbi:hypothetical protein NLG97_g1288 [Lecanicillium saksenae]|uniref:Uncharacterized protein n=1 Tax=Lecanicillium saksenae TaxID=468837 RepID=A0ACC1R5J3_9HYPO|nr:hypothetical protein NLG97_g1288 [Lecanicillium saksenae]
MQLSTLISLSLAPVFAIAGSGDLSGDACKKNCDATFDVGDPMACKSKQQCSDVCQKCHDKDMDNTRFHLATNLQLSLMTPANLVGAARQTAPTVSLLPSTEAFNFQSGILTACLFSYWFTAYFTSPFENSRFQRTVTMKLNTVALTLLAASAWAIPMPEMNQVANEQAVEETCGFLGIIVSRVLKAGCFDQSTVSALQGVLGGLLGRLGAGKKTPAAATPAAPAVKLNPAQIGH